MLPYAGKVCRANKPEYHLHFRSTKGGISVLFYATEQWKVCLSVESFYRSSNNNYNNNFISNTRQQVKLQLKLSKSERNYKLQWANGQTWAEYTICFSSYCCCSCCSCSIRMRFAYVRGQNKSLWPQQQQQTAATTGSNNNRHSKVSTLVKSNILSLCICNAAQLPLSCTPFSYPPRCYSPPPLDTVTVSGHHTANVIFETFQCV